MPDRSAHLQRLRQVWLASPVYFVTACTYRRRPILNDPRVAPILIEEWTAARERHGWHIGRHVIMPDHVHFFAAADADAKSLSGFVAKWKEWTAKRVGEAVGVQPPLWQPRFFDHMLRSDESRSEKWEYVRENPVRAGLVARSEDWPHQGFIHFE